MVTLTNIGSTYDGTQASQGLGLGLINFTGVTTITLLVRVNKIGTGTQSWQLWNETDGTQIGVIDDAGAAGTKMLQQAFPVALSGVKAIRIRAKSTVAADDPIFLGGAVLPQ